MWEWEVKRNPPLSFRFLGKPYRVWERKSSEKKGRRRWWRWWWERKVGNNNNRSKQREKRNTKNTLTHSERSLLHFYYISLISLTHSLIHCSLLLILDPHPSSQNSLFTHISFSKPQLFFSLTKAKVTVFTSIRAVARSSRNRKTATAELSSFLSLF